MSFSPEIGGIAGEPVSILLVDDDQSILETLVDIFQEIGYTAETASTGRQALRKMQDRFYNLALLDIQLPDMEGIALLSEARRLQPDMKCIMATGNATKDSAVAALNMGAHAYLEKPIDVQQVMDTLQGAVVAQRYEFINRHMVRTLAESFLSKTPSHPELDLASCFEFAAEVAQVGGDYFDFIPLDDGRLGVVIGDVCGKGVPAAIYTGKAKDMLYAYARLNSSPQWVMERLNHALYSQMSEECMFITMIYGVIDTKAGTFTYTNAAHPPAVLVHADGRVEELAPEGNGLVGAMPEMGFTEATVPLEPGAVITMFTDGVTEARVGVEMFGQEGAREVVREHAGERAQEIAEAVFHAAQDYARGHLRDDVAIVVVKHGK